MIKMKAVAFQTFFDFNKSSLVSVSKTRSMKPASMSVTSFCHLTETAGYELGHLHTY